MSIWEKWKLLVLGSPVKPITAAARLESRPYHIIKFQSVFGKLPRPRPLIFSEYAGSETLSLLVIAITANRDRGRKDKGKRKRGKREREIEKETHETIQECVHRRKRINN